MCLIIFHYRVNSSRTPELYSQPKTAHFNSCNSFLVYNSNVILCIMMCTVSIEESLAFSNHVTASVFRCMIQREMADRLLIYTENVYQRSRLFCYVRSGANTPMVGVLVFEIFFTTCPLTTPPSWTQAIDH